MTESRAHKSARTCSRAEHATIFVIYENDECMGGNYHTCTSYELDTWFLGIHENNVLACYCDGHIEE